jgi:hypothetical protein
MPRPAPEVIRAAENLRDTLDQRRADRAVFDAENAKKTNGVTLVPGR